MSFIVGGIPQAATSRCLFSPSRISAQPSEWQVRRPIPIVWSARQFWLPVRI